MPNYQLLAARDRIAQPWKNGGGVMWDIAISPEGANTETFAWRLSIAEISASRPFSLFPGITRHFALLEGEGVTLSFKGRPPVAITPADRSIQFSGHDEINATLNDGPVLALNLMMREGHLGSLDRVEWAIESPARSANAISILIAGQTAHNLDVGSQLLAIGKHDAVMFHGALPSVQPTLGVGDWLATIRPE